MVTASSMISKKTQMQNNWEVLSWTTKIKRKKAISLQPNLAVTMSWTVAVALSVHIAVKARTCPIADSKVAADKTSFHHRYKMRPDVISGLFFPENLSSFYPYLYELVLTEMQEVIYEQ